MRLADREVRHDHEPWWCGCARLRSASVTTRAAQMFAFPWVVSALPTGGSPLVIAFIGTGGTLLWRLLLRGPFEGRERALFRYA